MVFTCIDKTYFNNQKKKLAAIRIALRGCGFCDTDIRQSKNFGKRYEKDCTNLLKF